MIFNSILELLLRLSHHIEIKQKSKNILLITCRQKELDQSMQKKTNQQGFIDNVYLLTIVQIFVPLHTRTYFHFFCIENGIFDWQINFGFWELRKFTLFSLKSKDNRKPKTQILRNYTLLLDFYFYTIRLSYIQVHDTNIF